MYKVIGSDGKEYGPVSADQIRQWIAEGRLDAQTYVQVMGSNEWRTLGELPEFADALAHYQLTGKGFNRTKVQAPAIGLMVTAILGLCANLLALVLNILGFSQQQIFNVPPGLERLPQTSSGAIGITSCIIGIVVSGLVLYGALKMKKLESYPWAMTAAILALIPCVSPCCVLGLPIGIWALLVLSKPEVKAVFPQQVKL